MTAKTTARHRPSVPILLDQLVKRGQQLVMVSPAIAGTYRISRVLAAWLFTSGRRGSRIDHQHVGKERTGKVLVAC